MALKTWIHKCPSTFRRASRLYSTVQPLVLKWDPSTYDFAEPRHSCSPQRIRQPKDDVLYKADEQREATRIIRLIDSSVGSRHIPKAVDLLDQLAALVDQQLLISGIGLVVPHVERVDEQIKLVERYFQPEKRAHRNHASILFALAAKEACRKGSKADADELVTRWTDTFKLDPRLILRHREILSEADIQLISGGVTDISSGEPHSKEFASTYALFSEAMPGLEQLDPTAIQAATNGGLINYATLYELLDPTEKHLFERLYDRFNAVRQERLELPLNHIAETEEERPSSGSLAMLAWNWRKAAEEFFDSALDGKTTHWPDLSTDHKQVLQTIGGSKLASLLVQELLYSVVKYDFKDADVRQVTSVSLRIGNQVELLLLENLRRLHDKHETDRRKMFSVDAYWYFTDINKWTPRDRALVGASLLQTALEIFQVEVPNPHGEPQMKPAFWRTKHQAKMRTYGIVAVNEAVLKLRNSGKKKLPLLGTHLPLLVKPRPWTSLTSGGYHYGSDSLLSDNSSEVIAFVKKAMENQTADQFFDGIDAMSATAWTVNIKLLSVLEQVWKTGAEFEDIPCEPDESAYEHDMEQLKAMKDVPRPVMIRRKQKRHMQQVNARTDRRKFEVALESARLYGRHGDKFYFSYQIDFRGRVYPVSTSGFMHMSQDSIRSLFLFWQGKKLGESGLRWLKVHLANMFGMDKVSNEERAQFVMDHIEDVYDSVDDPLGGRQWWREGDKPFQTLAACYELTAALRSGNAESYVSRLPVMQDGSCNGLQHYSALGRDSLGASQVNMKRAPRPADIYSQVARMVQEKVSERAAAGDDTARALEGQITRRLVKQPVMTSVYGVTRFGIVRQLDDRFDEMAAGDDGHQHRYSMYVSHLILEAIEELFWGANQIKAWLDECVVRVCRSVRADFYSGAKITDDKFLSKSLMPMIWTTPLGFPVVQSYRKKEVIVVRAQLQSMNLYNPFALSYVDVAKQRQAIAPNFIHSLDSTHMLMTAVNCEAGGLTFAAVHDSFWTHAASMQELSQRLRQQFVKLYAQDVVARLRAELLVRCSGNMQLVYLSRNSRSYREVEELRSSYGNSHRRKVDILRRELQEEYKKFKGDSAAETPSSIIRRNGDEVYTKNARHEYVEYGAGMGEAKRHDDDGGWSEVFVPVGLPALPTTGTYDVAEVLHSEYFFS